MAHVTVAQAAPADAMPPAKTPSEPPPPASAKPVAATAATTLVAAKKEDDLQTAKVAGSIQEKSCSVGCLRALTSSTPTNYEMLLFRTLNPLMRRPGHNADDVAPRLRDHLLPVRSWWLKHIPWAKYQLSAALENRFGVPGCVNFIDARTKWFDAGVISAVGSGTIKQVVVLAAGFDTRSLRLAPPNGAIKFFEIDLPSASQRKVQLVQRLNLLPPQVQAPTFVGADLSQVDLVTALRGTGFDATQPTLFTIEGLLYYLPEEAVLSLLAHVGLLASSGSCVMLDIMHAAALEGRARSDTGGFCYAGFKTTAQAVANKGEPYRFGIRDAPEAMAALLAEAHRRSVQIHAAGGGPDPSLPPPKGLRLTQYLGPREIMDKHLPHLKWSDTCPPLAAFYSYAAAEAM